MLSFVLAGREERFFDKFVVSPDNQLLVFLGKDGYMPLVSNKVGEITILLSLSVLNKFQRLRYVYICQH